MSGTYQKSIVLGRLGRDPELRHTGSGKAVCSFSLATDEYGDKTEWHNIVAWEKTAQFIAREGRKGARVLVAGRLQTRKWQADDGTERRRTEIVCEPGGLNLLDWPEKGDSRPDRSVPTPDTEEYDMPDGDDFDDDLPF